MGQLIIHDLASGGLAQVQQFLHPPVPDNAEYTSVVTINLPYHLKQHGQHTW